MSTTEDNNVEEQNKGLGERMKTYEKEDRVPHDKHIVIRVDGKTFSKFTKKFTKPFDPRFTRAMVRTMNSVMRAFNVTFAFCCSDEITFVIPARSIESGHDFNGRRQKINSLFAGKCTAYFLIHIMEEVKDEETLEFIRSSAPCFDSRLMVFDKDNEFEICNNLYWRSRSKI